jgi:hypothetical protein
VLSDRFKNVDLREVQTKRNEQKTICLSFICKIAMQCNCNCNSLFTSFLSHQVSIWTRVHFVLFSALCIQGTCSTKGQLSSALSRIKRCHG